MVQQKKFKSAVLAVQANMRMRNRFMNKVEDPLNPYSNHSETESSEEEEVEIEEGPPEILPDGTVRPSIIPRPSVAKPRSALWRYRGMLLALLSSLIFSCGALVAKKLPSFHPLSLAFWRFQGAFLPILPLISYRVCVLADADSILSGLWPLNQLKNMGMLSLVLLRSALSCNSLLLHFYSLKYMSLGDSLTIASSTPILVAILARLFLGEKCGLVTLVASLLTFMGVIAMTRPPILTGEEAFDTDTLIGSALALGCMILAAISYTVLRYIRKVHWTMTTLLFGVWGTLENLLLGILLQVMNVPSSLSDWGLVAGLASFTFFGQCAIILAMKAEQAGPVALIRTCDVIFGFALQIIFLGKIPDWLSIVGAAVVMVAVAVCGFRKYLRGLPVGHPRRAKYRYLMM